VDTTTVAEATDSTESSSWRKRWATKEVIIAWNVSSWFTIGQMTLGKTFLTWFAVKFPWVAPLASKVWSGITAAVGGFLAFFS
jgi:hypothetical protein